MKYPMILLSFAILSSVLLSACTSVPTGPGLRTGMESVKAPTAWLGEEPHLVLAGTINGVHFSIDINKDDPRIKKVQGKREYQKLASNGEMRYLAFELGFGALMEGLEREIELEFENADFNRTSTGIDLVLVAKSNEDLANIGGLSGTRSNLELEWEWEDARASDFSAGEVLSSAGTLIRHIDEGQRIGAWFTATFPMGKLTGSFTTSTAEDETDTVDAFYL